MNQISTNISCTLKANEFQDRLKMIREKVIPCASNIEELKNGYRLSFSSTPKLRLKIEQFVNLEKHCCGFLNFDLLKENRDDQFLLEVTGSQEAKAYIQQQDDQFLLEITGLQEAKAHLQQQIIT